MKLYKISYCYEKNFMLGWLINENPPYQLEFVHGNPTKKKPGKIGDYIHVCKGDGYQERYFKNILSQRVFETIQDLVQDPGHKITKFYYENKPFYSVIPVYPFEDTDLSYDEMTKQRPEGIHYFRGSFTGLGVILATEAFYERLKPLKPLNMEFTPIEELK